jgi:hypothetical protein
MIKQLGVISAHPASPIPGVYHFYSLTDGSLWWQTPTDLYPLTAITQWANEVVMLNATQITNKAVNLANTPTVPESVFLIIEGAPPQIQSRSWDVSGSTLSWAGTDIDGVLEEGDYISIKYLYA